MAIKFTNSVKIKNIMMSSAIHWFISIFLLFLPLIHFAQKGEISYELSKEKSSLTWSARNQQQKFSGKMKIKEGKIVMKDKELSQAVLFVNAQSFICSDCGDPETAKKLSEFVKSSDFLNSEAMDFAVFKMYKSESIDNSKDGNYRIEGALTIKGYSNNISLPVMLLEKKDKIYIEGSVTLNRSLWHLDNPKDYDPNAVIDQTVELFFNLEGEKMK